MKSTNFQIKNLTTITMHFHVEPECEPFSIAPGSTLDLSGSFEDIVPSIQYSSDSELGVFGSVFPGDGQISVKIDGVIIF